MANLDFSNEKKFRKQVEKLEKKEVANVELNVDEQNAISNFSTAVKVLTSKASWTQNIGITNKEEQKKKFKENRNNFEPDWKFKNNNIEEEKYIKLIEKLKDAVKENITNISLEKYDNKTIGETTFQEFYLETFEELKYRLKIAKNIEDRETWKKYCMKCWPVENKESFENSLKFLKNNETPVEEDKVLNAEDVKKMWESELDRIDLDYNVEIRDVRGCFNIPEEKTVVVANGENKERTYSREEAKILTMHELFHVVRAYNGFNIGKSDEFPSIMGIHTPFYDKTEEGGAIFREYETDVINDEKEFDYHLRNVAAYYTKQDIRFSEIVKRLMDLGGTLDRSFYLAARNREVLRHHIYIQGFQDHWKQNKKPEKMLIGKLNPKYSNLFYEEAEAQGMFEKPKISYDQLFDYKFE